MMSSDYGIIHVTGTDMRPFMWAKKPGQQNSWVVLLERPPSDNMKHRFYVTEMVRNGEDWMLSHNCPKHYSHTLSDASTVFAKLAKLHPKGALVNRKGMSNG